MDNNNFVQTPNNQWSESNTQNEEDKWSEFRSQTEESEVIQNPAYKKKKKSHKGLKIFLIILAVFIVLIILFSIIGYKFSLSLFDNNTAEQIYDTDVQHLSVLNINGTISETDSSTVYETSTYNQNWLINKIEELENDTKNEGIVLYIDTPGGSVYATDEIYLKLLEYKEKTGKPVYTAMGPTCASGGYYIACASNKIFANRNTITGSIGVTFGTSFDISQLLANHGVTTTTLTSGANKAMGSMYSPMTQEQIDIYMSIINESYAQFTNVVAIGRNMPIETVTALADGRIYTAQQAANNGLIDGVMDYDSTIETFKTDQKLGDCPVYEYSYSEDTSLYNMIFGIADKFINKKSDSYDNEISSALKMAEEESYNEPYYLMK